MKKPEKYKNYHCEDYFLSQKYVNGIYDEPSQLWVIIPAIEVEEDIENEFLVIGRPGFDGLQFGYRKHKKGLWVHYPIENEFTLLAPNIATLADGWINGKISV